MNKDIVVFICTHGRPNKQYTLEALRSSGYSGVVCLIVDDEDDTYEDYLKLTDATTIVHKFCKQYYIDRVDLGYSRANAKRGAILYAKCECESFAKRRGTKFFIIADDDITGFRYRYEYEGRLKSETVTKNMDSIILEYCNTMLGSGIVASSFGDVRA